MPNASGARRSAQRCAVVVAGVLVMSLAGSVGTAGAVPPPPPNPSDSELHHSQHRVDKKAAAVGNLTSEVAAAKDKLRALSDKVEVKRELANKALVDLQQAEAAAQRASDAAEGARAQADAAQQRVDKARDDLDTFAASSYEAGRTIGSMSAFLGAKSPKNLLDRQQLLGAVSGSKLDAIGRMRKALVAKANKDSLARAALAKAKDKKAAAGRARDAAAAAKRAAVEAQQQQEAKTGQLRGRTEDLKAQLQAARDKAGNLKQQRANYNDWLDRKKAAEAAARRAAQSSSPPASSGGGSGGGAGAVAASSSTGSVSAVIARARSVLGMPYAWGGGNYYGPTHGIHDGGVADSYGDYKKIGFDCSGLMMYAFAAAGVHLTHFTGYQYNAGSHVPLSQKQPGDMLFWHSGSFIHHVALYIGNGMMIEAPQSGSVVQISPVRYGGIMPYATRVL